MYGLYPKSESKDLIFIAVGVFPLPPIVIFPIQITGTGLFCGTTNLVSSIIKNRHISVAGESKYCRNDFFVFGLSQNLGNNILDFIIIETYLLSYLKTF